MNVVELLERRRQNWQELEALCMRLKQGNRAPLNAEMRARFASLYRAACADLALADAYQLPQPTIAYLHQLVARAHNQLYRAQRFDVSAWGRELFVDLPHRLYHDWSLKLAFALFWGFFLASMTLAAVDHRFASALVGEETLEQMEEMHAESAGGKQWSATGRSTMAGFYIQHNTSIGLQSFASGLVFGVGGLLTLIFNAAFLGAAFGHMATSDRPGEFFQFVTAHGPFELTAIVVSAAAGMRLGFSIVDPRGWTRSAALARAAKEAVPTMALAVLLFALAALIEGFLSPSPAPYTVKVLVAVLSTVLMLGYYFGLGPSWEGRRAA
ncbi:MAG TPA: stage II sporulation protein M [Pirellulales bacterium]